MDWYPRIQESLIECFSFCRGQYIKYHGKMDNGWVCMDWCSSSREHRNDNRSIPQQPRHRSGVDNSHTRRLASLFRMHSLDSPTRITFLLSTFHSRQNEIFFLFKWFPFPKEREWTELDGTAVSRRSVAQVRVNSGDPGRCPKIRLKEPGPNGTSAGFQTDENRYYTLILAEKAEKR